MSSFKQSSSRNQRTKGWKMKHILQIIVLVGICAWLIYQVKHSHDKKKVFEAQSSKLTEKIDEAQPEIFRINRKDIPQIVEINNREVSNNEDVDETDETEQENFKQEEAEGDQGKDDGNSEIDEEDREREDEEAEHGEFDDEEEKEGHEEKLNLVENKEHETRSHEAQEETFKGDDAASAVAESTHKPELEIDGGSKSLEEKIPDAEAKNVEVENIENTTNSTFAGFSDTNVVDVMGGNENTFIGNSTSSEVDDDRRELKPKPETNSSLTESLEEQHEPRGESGDQTAIQTGSEIISEMQLGEEHNNTTDTLSADATGPENVNKEQNEAHREEREALQASSDSIHDQNENLEKETQTADVSNTENVAAEGTVAHAEQEKEASHVNSDTVQDHNATSIEETRTADTANAENFTSEHADPQGEVQDSLDVKDEKEGSQEKSELVLDQTIVSSNAGSVREHTETHTEEMNASHVEEEKEGFHGNSNPAQGQEAAFEERHTVNDSDVENTNVALNTLTEEEKEARSDLSVLSETKNGVSVEEVASE